eukprot:scaffold1019_cov324-Prasinococcus_capsulatus_cf.AAC.1
MDATEERRVIRLARVRASAARASPTTRSARTALVRGGCRRSCRHRRHPAPAAGAVDGCTQRRHDWTARASRRGVGSPLARALRRVPAGRKPASIAWHGMAWRAAGANSSIRVGDDARVLSQRSAAAAMERGAVRRSWGRTPA